MSDLTRSWRFAGVRTRSLPRVRAHQFDWVIQTVALFAATRGIVSVTAYLANVALPSRTGDGLWHAMPGNLFLDVWARWDSAFYLDIANEGYTYPEPGHLSNLAFFPLYPLVMKLVGSLTGNMLAAGILVSLSCLLGAMLILNRLTQLEFGDSDTAQRAVFYLAAFPSSLFFSAVYTESMFLLFAVGCVYCARRKWWVAAGALGALASATRIVGVVLWPVLVVEWLRAHGCGLATLRDRAARVQLFHESLRDWPSFLAISVTLLGVASYGAFLSAIFQDPIAFWTVQALWGRENHGPIAAVSNAIAAFRSGDLSAGVSLYWNVPLDLAALAMGLGIGIAVFRRLGASYGLFTILGVVIPSWSYTDSMIRYVAVLFPVFMMLGHWGRKPLLDRCLSTVFLVLLGVCVAIFANWEFLA